MRRGALAAALVVCLPGMARAGVEDWRVNEVGARVGGDGAIRFVELYAPPSETADNCFFPTTRLEVFDGGGALLGQVTPFGTTVCFAGDTYVLFATMEASAHYGVARDTPLGVALPPEGGQVCLRSSATRYDCARWGSVTAAVKDLDAPGDDSAAPAIPDGLALARVGDTGVVAGDFVIQEATPRGPNDGSGWDPPDGGALPDAPGLPDGNPRVDATPSPDGPVGPAGDAGPRNPGWLTADPGGSPACGCRAGGRSGPGAGASVVILILAAGTSLARRRRPV